MFWETLCVTYDYIEGEVLMNSLHLAENMVELRRKRGVTQEELADFIGVTKASVSKWENGQSMPDIILLPQLANYYDVTVDELLGYEPQLSKEQIQKIYQELAEAFATEPFEEVFHRSQMLVKKYYSCYRFLTQICVLWTNHYMMAGDAEAQQKILNKIKNLCEHILENCKNTAICSDVMIMKAIVDMQCGHPENVVEALVDLLNPQSLANQSDTLLIQAYLMMGNREMADSYAQASMFLHLLLLVGGAVSYLNIHAQEKECCEETIQRTDALIEAYQFDTLHQNMAASYYYQVAAVMCLHGEHEEALKRLKLFANNVAGLLKLEHMLHGDAYFSKLDTWFEQMDLGAQAVRDKRLILQSARESLLNPVFDVLRENKEFKKIEKMLES